MDEFEKNEYTEPEDVTPESIDAAEEPSEASVPAGPEMAEIEFPDEPETSEAAETAYDFAAVMDESEPAEVLPEAAGEPADEPAEEPADFDEEMPEFAGEPEEELSEAVGEPEEEAAGDAAAEPADEPGDSTPAEPADVPAEEPADFDEEPIEFVGEPEEPYELEESEPAEIPEASGSVKTPKKTEETEMAKKPGKQAKAEKPEKPKKTKKYPSTGFRVAVRLIAVLIVILLALGAFYFGYSIFNQKPVTESGDPETYVISVDEGDGVQEIASELKEAGIIRSVIIMRIQDKIFDYGLAPGTFEVNSGMNSLQILSWLSDSNHTLADTPDDADVQSETQAPVPAETAPETETVSPEGA